MIFAERTPGVPRREGGVDSSPSDNKILLVEPNKRTIDDVIEE